MPKKKKAKTKKKHKALRYCFKCKRTHSISEHSFHGKGAFKKTHKKTTTKAKKRRR